MEIVRTTKREPIDFASLSRAELVAATNPRNGSKFLSEWSLERLVNWTEAQIRLQNWRFPPGVQARIRVQLDRPVGYSGGKLVSTITVMASGRWVHAFPDE
jgi:hypothetical protein